MRDKTIHSTPRAPRAPRALSRRDVKPGGIRTEALPIAGVRLVHFVTHPDERGALTEIFRDEWGTGVAPVQWNLVRSRANVLRGVHVHIKHADYLVVPEGRATFGLRDLRPGSPSEHVACTVELGGPAGLAALVIPVGVAHGFYFHVPSVVFYAVTRTWDPDDELGCRFDDPALGIAWPEEARSPILSPRDVTLPPLAALDGKIPRFAAT